MSTTNKLADAYLPDTDERRAEVEGRIKALKQQRYATLLDLAGFRAQHPGAKADKTVNIDTGRGIAQTTFGQYVEGLERKVGNFERMIDALRDELESLADPGDEVVRAVAGAP